MQRSGPSLAPTHGAATYVVLDEFEDGRIFRETDEAEADRETFIQDIVSGQYKTTRPNRCLGQHEISWNA
jgi:hypothetical protein